MTFFVGLDNLSLDFSFTSNNMVGSGYAYSLEDNRSSAIEYLQNLSENSILNFFIILISLVSFFINRSELWGLFFARYNPNFAEFLFGSGSFNLAKHYGEIKLLETKFSFASLEFVKYIVIFWVFSINYFCIIFFKQNSTN